MVGADVPAELERAAEAQKLIASRGPPGVADRAAARATFGAVPRPLDLRDGRDAEVEIVHPCLTN
jgi:hypothetical protein